MFDVAEWRNQISVISIRSFLDPITSLVFDVDLCCIDTLNL